MDTQTIIEAKYGISKRDLHTVPTWAKNERLERTVPLTEMWHMGMRMLRRGKNTLWADCKLYLKGFLDCIYSRRTE